MKPIGEIAALAARRLDQRLIVRRCLQAAGTVLLLWLLAWVALPPLLKWQLETQASAALGRTVRVGRVDFRPWSLELALEKLSLAEASGTQAQLTIDRIQLDAELASLPRRALVLDALRIEHPHLRLRHLGAGQLDIDDLIARLRQPEQPAGPPPRFQVANLELLHGELDLSDDSVGHTHELRDINLTLPRLSSLGARHDAPAEPRLAFTLNGAPFEARASSTPFAPGRHSTINLKAAPIDIQPYLPYWPRHWPLRPRQGAFELDLALVFEQAETPELKLSGQLAARDMQFDELSPDGRALPLASWQELRLEFSDSRPLARQLHLEALHWIKPQLHLRRDAQGRLNPQRLLAAILPRHTDTPKPAPPDTTGWTLALKQFELDAGRLRWQDAAASPAAEIDADEIALHASAIAWPGTHPAELKGSARVAGGTLSWNGQASERAARIGLSARDLSLATARPYLPPTLPSGLTGRLSTEVAVDWKAAGNDTPSSLELKAPKLELRALALGPGAQPLAAWSRLALEQVALDLPRHSLAVGKLLLEQPRLQLSRAAGGRWMFEDWLAAAAAPASTPSASTTTNPPWQVTLGDVALRQGEVAFADATPAHPVQLLIQGLELQTRDLQPLSATPTTQPLNLSLRLASQAGQDGGRLSYRGNIRLPAPAPAPAAVAAGNALAAQGALELDRLPLAVLEPYFGSALNLRLLQADASLRGTLDAALPPEGLSLTLKGDLGIDHLRADTLEPAERLLDWNSLDLRGLRLGLTQGRLDKVEVGETVLSDYFARVIINPDGTINLQQLLREPAIAPNADHKAETVRTSARNTGTAAAQAAPVIRIGPSTFVKGRVHFSDRFIQPNYSADLSELSGHLGSFDNQAAATGQAAPMAELSLSGHAEDTATLEVSGRLNPLAQPLALDIQGAVRELDLPPLSPYSAKYAGYGIERGKLSMDVRYRIDPGGQLEASNRVVLNQLVFGDRIAGSEAPDLPIKLAVALLADHDGVINVNLPISGSINDPQFRLGAIVGRLIFSLVAKAVTAPFALLTHALGGSAEEFHQIDFAPGSAALDASSLQRLDQVAAVMTSRPGLMLTIAGESDLERERSAYQREQVRALVREEKRRTLQRQDSASASEAATELSDSEYPELLTRVYRRADIPKPRNVIGLARELPLADMEALLQASVAVDEEALRELARHRSVAVRDRLLALRVPPERLFLGAPQARAAQDQGWKPRTDLRLETR